MQQHGPRDYYIKSDIWCHIKSNVWCHLYAKFKIMVQMNLQNKNRLRYWKQADGYQRGQQGQGDTLRVQDWQIHTTLNKIDNHGLPDGPVVKNLCFQCRGHGSISGPEN